MQFTHGIYHVNLEEFPRDLAVASMNINARVMEMELSVVASMELLVALACDKFKNNLEWFGLVYWDLLKDQ